jgi:hypothetical protein
VLGQCWFIGAEHATTATLILVHVLPSQFLRLFNLCDIGPTAEQEECQLKQNARFPSSPPRIAAAAATKASSDEQPPSNGGGSLQGDGEKVHLAAPSSDETEEGEVREAPETAPVADQPQPRDSGAWETTSVGRGGRSVGALESGVGEFGREGTASVGGEPAAARAGGEKSGLVLWVSDRDRDRVQTLDGGNGVSRLKEHERGRDRSSPNR